MDQWWSPFFLSPLLLPEIQTTRAMSSSTWSFVYPTVLERPRFLLPPPGRRVFSPCLLQAKPRWRWSACCLHKKEPNNLSASSKLSASHLEKLSLLLQYGAILAAVEAPSAMAVTGENLDMEDDLMTTLISAGIVAVVYFLMAPPIIMTWLKLRWYKRKFLEMYLQFMFVFLFFPGLLLWAPFVNVRKLPRDPTMEYPWSKPKDDVPLISREDTTMMYPLSNPKDR